MSGRDLGSQAKLDAESRVCMFCAGGDEYLRDLVASALKKGRCAVCSRLRKTMQLSELANAIDSVFQKYVQPIEDYYRSTEGSSPSELLYDILNCDSDELVIALVSELASMQQYAIHHDGVESLYDVTSNYEIAIPHSTHYDDGWKWFVSGVKHRGRFFLEEEQLYLYQLFRPLLNGELHGGKPPIETLGAPESAISSIYRGRAANTKGDQKQILENPRRELGPPPPSLRAAGRMNSPGVAVFYGATDINTCVAELGIPVGGAAIVGRFEFLRPLRILDLRQLGSAFSSTSYFDPQLEQKSAYAEFMRDLRDTIRKPVLPGEQMLDYLPTQMIAEFLSRADLDGVMFVSSRTAPAETEATSESDSGDPVNSIVSDTVYSHGVNIVLFSHAARVEGDMNVLRRRIIRVEEPAEIEELFADLYYVLVSNDAPLDVDVNSRLEETEGEHEPTLRLIDSDVVLVVPKSIEYKVKVFEPSFVSPRHQSEF